MLAGFTAATQDINVLGTKITAPDGARLESRRFKIGIFRHALHSAKRNVQREGSGPAKLQTSLGISVILTCYPSCAPLAVIANALD